MPFAKAMQVRAMKTRFLIAERSLLYAKAMQVRAMKTRFLIAERSLLYAKLAYLDEYQKNKNVFFALCRSV